MFVSGLVPNSFVNTGVSGKVGKVCHEGLAVISPTGITGCLLGEAGFIKQMAIHQGGHKSQAISVHFKHHRSDYINHGIIDRYAIATKIWCTLSMPAYLLPLLE